MKYKRLLSFCAGVLSLTVGMHSASAQTLGDVSMAAALGGSLGAAGGFMTPSQYTRGVGNSRSNNDVEYSLDTDADFTGLASQQNDPKSPTIFGAPPTIPAPKSIARTPAQLVQELLSPAIAYRQMHISSNSTPRPGTALGSRFVVQATSQAARKRSANWQAYYLPADRVKFKSGAWKFVTIEDDYGAYPMAYYYRPWSAPMLQLLSDARRRGRVIGFRNWQEAMRAGYRPDPISKPEPGAQLAQIAAITRTRYGVSSQLGAYLEYLYNGMIQESAFNNHYAYAMKIRNLLAGRSDTRSYLPDVVSSVFGQAVGVGEVPQTVGGGVALQTGRIGGPESILDVIQREDRRTYR